MLRVRRKRRGPNEKSTDCGYAAGNNQIKASMAASYTSNPYWEANYNETSEWSNASYRLLGSVMDPNEPIIVAFDAERGMANEMWPGGRLGPRSQEGKTTPVVIRVDDNPRSCTLSARGTLNDASALLPGGKEEDDLWKALYNVKRLRLTISAEGEDRVGGAA